MGTISISNPSDGQTIDAADVATPLNTIVAAINGNLDDDNIKTGANINGTKLLAGSVPGTSFDATTAGGWITTTIAAPNTVTNNGNKTYDLVFNSVDYTQEVSPGMKLKLTRTVTAPTQCADLESSSSHYFSKTSPSGISFTDDYTTMAWVKMESYHSGGIIARRNADTEGWSLTVNSTGTVQLTSLRIAGNNSVTATYASLPLNKWVHIAASADLSGTTTTIYFDGVAVPALTTVTGTCTALVQGTTALVVGAEKSAGTNPFDGKIAQAAVFNAVLSAATIRSYMSQTLSGSETSCVSAYSFNNVITDLNTSNANNLSPQNSAVATNVDSPFAGGADYDSAYTAGTTEYAEIISKTFSTNTTLVVRVPDGYAIPTSGGVSAVSYSTQSNPLGWPGISNIIGYVQTASAFSTTSTSAVDIPGLTYTTTVPAGRRIRITAFSSRILNATQPGNGMQIEIYQAGVRVSGASSDGYTVNNAGAVGITTGIGAPTSGSVTWKAMLLTIGAGTASTQSSSTAPSYLMIELV